MASTPKSGKTDQYSEEEAQKRFMQSLKGAVSTSPKPLKEISPKRHKQDRSNIETEPTKAEK
jgi:hypothetical protein